MIARRVACSVVALGVGATACATADPGTIKGAIEEKKQAGKTQSIEVPSAPDATRTGRVGLQLSTNSAGWRKTLDTADVEGAAVLLVYPGSPAERAGFARGDVITRVGGSAIRNDERALVALRGRPGVALHVVVERATGPADLQVTPGPAIKADFVKLVDDLLAEKPADPTNLLLRAQASEDLRDSITYVNRALDVEPDFIDALVYRARLFWAESMQITNEAIIQEDRRRATDVTAGRSRSTPTRRASCAREPTVNLRSASGTRRSATASGPSGSTRRFRALTTWSPRPDIRAAGCATRPRRRGKRSGSTRTTRTRIGFSPSCSSRSIDARTPKKPFASG